LQKSEENKGCELAWIENAEVTDYQIFKPAKINRRVRQFPVLGLSIRGYWPDSPQLNGIEMAGCSASSFSRHWWRDSRARFSAVWDAEPKVLKQCWQITVVRTVTRAEEI
jgi:hypothetical protein